MVTYDLTYLDSVNLEEYENETRQNLHSSKVLGVEPVDEAIIVPNAHDGKGEGIFDSTGRFILHSNLHEALDNIPLYPTKEVDYQDEVVIYIGDLYSCFWSFTYR